MHRGLIIEAGGSVLSIVGALVVFFVMSFLFLKFVGRILLSGGKIEYLVPFFLYTVTCILLSGFLANFLYGELRYLWGLL